MTIPARPQNPQNTPVTWTAVEALIADRWHGRRIDRAGTMRWYRVPSPTGGTFLVEVALRPRWCSISVDRWRTTDRSDAAEPWLREHVRPHVLRAHEHRGTGYGVMPIGGPTFTGASPIDRRDLLRRTRRVDRRGADLGCPAGRQRSAKAVIDGRKHHPSDRSTRTRRQT